MLKRLTLCLVAGLAAMAPVHISAAGLPAMTESLERLGCSAVPESARPLAVALSIYPESVRSQVAFEQFAEYADIIRLCGAALTDSSCTAETIEAFIAIGSEAPGSARFMQTMGRFEAVCLTASVVGKLVESTLPAKICAAAEIGRAVYQGASCERRKDALAQIALKVDWPLVLSTGFEPVLAISHAVAAGRINRDEANMLSTEIIGRQGLMHSAYGQ